MARLPRYQSRGTITTDISSANTVNPLGKVISALGEKGFEIAKDWRDAEDTEKSLSTLNEYNIKSAELKQQADTDIDYKNKEKWQNEYNTLLENSLSQLPDSDIGKKYGAQINHKASYNNIELSNDFNNKMIKTGKSHFGIANKLEFDNYRLAPNLEMRQESIVNAKANTEDAYAKGFISLEERFDSLNRIQNEWGVQAAERDLFDNPDKVLETIDTYNMSSKQKKEITNAANKRRQVLNEELLLNNTKTDTITITSASEIINNPESTSEDIESAITSLSLQGDVTKSFATSLEKLLTSKEAVTAKTSTDVYSGFIQRLSMLKESAPEDYKEYLRGMQNLQTEIVNAQANGTLTKEDAGKITRETVKYSSAENAKAVQDIQWSMTPANEVFNNTLTPDYRGQATIEYFNIIDGRELDKNQQRGIANQIATEIQNKRRQQGLIAVDNVYNQKTDINTFYDKYNITRAQVLSTAKSRGISEEEVIKAYIKKVERR